MLAKLTNELLKIKEFNDLLRKAYLNHEIAKAEMGGIKTVTMNRLEVKRPVCNSDLKKDERQSLAGQECGQGGPICSVQL